MTNIPSASFSSGTLQDIKEIFIGLGREHARLDDPTRHRDDVWLWKRAEQVVRYHLRPLDTRSLDGSQIRAEAQSGYIEGWLGEQHALIAPPCLHLQCQVWAIGYRDPGGVALLDQMESSDCTLFLDIRDRPLAPYQPRWSRKRLSLRFGRRYRHLQALGNIHYRDHHLPILLRNEEAGLECLLDWLLAGWNVVLICACQDREHCHGTLVLRLLKEHLPHDERVICHLPPPVAVEIPM